jgi:hypothetical protein
MMKIFLIRNDPLPLGRGTLVKLRAPRKAGQGYCALRASVPPPPANERGRPDRRDGKK